MKMEKIKLAEKQEKETKEIREKTKQESVSSSEKQIKVVRTVEDVSELLYGEQIKMSLDRTYRELEYILHGMMAQCAPIELIKFVQGDAVSYAVRIGRYGYLSPDECDSTCNVYWSLYDQGAPNREIERVRVIIQQGIKNFKCVTVENNVVNKYREKWNDTVYIWEKRRRSLHMNSGKE